MLFKKKPKPHVSKAPRIQTTPHRGHYSSKPAGA
jgi:hypothetical protein